MEEVTEPMAPFQSLAEPLSAPPNDFTPEMAAEALREDAFVASAPSEPMPMFLVEENIDEAASVDSALPICSLDEPQRIQG